MSEAVVYLIQFLLRILPLEHSTVGSLPTTPSATSSSKKIKIDSGSEDELFILHVSGKQQLFIDCGTPTFIQTIRKKLV